MHTSLVFFWGAALALPIPAPGQLHPRLWQLPRYNRAAIPREQQLFVEILPERQQRE